MKAANWREHPEARAELLAEVERLPLDVAELLTASVMRAVDDVLRSPQSWPTVSYWEGLPTLRRRRVRPFRLNVVYYIAGAEVRVIAYAHERRRPGYWSTRVG